MVRSYWTLPLLFTVMGGCFLSIASGYSQSNPASNPYLQKPRQGISNEGLDASRPQPYQGTNRKEIAYRDEIDEDIHSRANRKGDWDYKQNWRYDRKAFYSGKTQGEALDEETPEGEGGIGMDPDTEYLEMRDYYLEHTGKHPGKHPGENYREMTNGNRETNGQRQFESSDQNGSRNDPRTFQHN